MRHTTLTVHVTAQDIAQGTPGHALYCPLGEALARQHPDAEWFVLPDRVWSGIEGREGPTYALPAAAIAYVAAYDSGEAVQPATFTLTRAPRRFKQWNEQKGDKPWRLVG